MRRLPQEFAFPLGLGSKRPVPNSDGEPVMNNKIVTTNNIAAVAPSPDDITNTRDMRDTRDHDLDTIDL